MVNNVVLVGYISTDPRILVLKTGKSVANFDLQVRRNYKTSEGRRVYDFLPCRVFLPSTIQYIEKYLKKNSQIAVIGKVQTEVYTDRNDRTQKNTYILVESAQAIRAYKGGMHNMGTPPPVAENEDFASMGSVDTESDPLAAVDW